jgi:manganese/zinc/iron transport system permease protein
MDDFLRLITLQDHNTRVVLLGAALLGAAAGVVGCFAVLRRRALVGDAVAHASLPGVCLAYLVLGERSLPAFLGGALVLGALGVVCIGLIRRHTRLKEDAAIAVVLASFFGVGVALSKIIQNQPGGNRAGLDSFIFGKAAGMLASDLILIATLAALAVVLVILFYKEFRLLCFDREFAASCGRPVAAFDFLLMGLVCLCTVVGLPAVGAILMVAMLVIPAAGARFWTERLGVMLTIAAVAGAASGVTGSALSALAPRLSAGPVIVLAAAAFFLVSLLAAPRRGVLAAWFRRRDLRRRILVQNLLRALHEIAETGGRGEEPALALSRRWSHGQIDHARRLAARQGFIESGPAGLTLTPAGYAKAAEVVRAHGLWELYLIEHADIAPDHVDRDADAIEHILDPVLVRDLEDRLRAAGRLPSPLPASPHALGPGGGAA